MDTIAQLRDQLTQQILATPLERGFCASVLTEQPDQLSRARPCAAVFPTALALTALQNANQPATAATEKRMAEALWNQSSEQGSWNYWQRNGPDAAREPYPDDLDTTCCALAALAGATPERITGDLLAKVTMLLLTTEVETGGPYRTWLVPPSANNAWKDVDPAVNANIGRFLDGQEVELPGLMHFLKTQLTQGQAQSPYYLSPIATYYFLSHWWKKKEASAACENLRNRQQKNGSWGTPLETAWAVSALLRWEGRSPEAAQGIDWLVHRPQKMLARPFPICIHGQRQKTRIYLGASLVTLTAVVEALTAWQHLQTTAHALTAPTHHTVRIREAAIMEQINARFSRLPQPLRSLAQAERQRFRTSSNGTAAALLPSQFAATLRPGIQTQLPEALLVRLGMVNVYGWMAYTIYDNLLDQEGGVHELPVANVCLRELSIQYAAFARRSNSVHALFCRIMDQLDAANAWEQSHWRLQKDAHGLWSIPTHLPLPDAESQRIAQRALGHALGPLTLLALAGRDSNHPQFRTLESFFAHYIIARQMDDDAHDWEEDLIRGQVNSVSATLLNAWIAKHRTQTLSSDVFPAVRAFFWETHAEQIFTQIATHLQRAKDALARLPFIHDPKPLQQLLTPIQQSLQRATTERKKVQTFLKTYRAPIKKSEEPAPPWSTPPRSP